MGLPLFTADYSTRLESNDGNRILLERGAIALRQSRAIRPTSGLWHPRGGHPRPEPHPNAGRHMQARGGKPLARTLRRETGGTFAAG